MASIRNLMIRLGVEMDDRGTKKLGGSLDRLTGQAKSFGVAMGLAFGASTVVDFARDSIKAASDLGESMSKTNVVFGKSAKSVVDFSRNAATSMGQSNQQALEATATFGNLFVSMRIGQPQAAGMSMKMVQLASDMASFNNVSPEETLVALRAGLVGETEPLRRFGVNINDASLKAEAMRLGLGKIGPTLTASQRAQASYSLILKQSKTAQGDFARTSGGLANQQRILAAQFIDTKAAIGEALLPVALALVKWFNSAFIPGLKSAVQWSKENAGTIKVLAISVGVLVTALIGIKAVTLAIAAQMALVKGATLAWAAATRIAALASGGFSRTTAAMSSGMDTLRLRTMMAGDAIRTAGGPVSALKNSLGGVSGVVSKAKGALTGMMGMLGGPWGIALIAAGAVLAIFMNRNAASEERVRGLTDAIKEDSGVLGVNTRAKVANSLETQGLLADAQRLGISLSTMTDAAMGEKNALAQVTAKLDASDRATDSLGKTTGFFIGTHNGLIETTDRLRNGLGATNTELNDARSSVKRVDGALGTTNTTGQGTVKMIDELGKTAVGSATDLDKLNNRVSKFNSLTGDADSAGIEFRNTIDDMTAAFKKNGLQIDHRTGSFNLNTRKGRDNNAMLIEAIRRAGDHADKVFKQTNSVKAANKTFDAEIRVIREVIAKHGQSRNSINALISKYVEAKNRINGATNAIKNRTVRIEVKAGGTLIGYHVQGGTLLKASGGVLPGYTPGQDPHMFYSPTGGTLGLSGGEAVMRPEWTRAVGKQNVDKMNSAARTGGVGGVKRVLASGLGRYNMGGEGAFFAGGGIISKGSVSGVSSVQNMAHKANTLYGIWGKNIGASISKAMSKLLGVGGPKVQKALAWAKSQSGKPYVWGGVGPGGYDCSGFMSAITNVIHGKSPYSRLFSTRSFGATSGPGGFRRNLNSGFKVGVTNAGVGHMAGTLGKTNVESNGSQGVHYGPGARGWNNSLFGYHYGLKMNRGGVMPPWKMDNGGLLTPGTTAVNTTREPEAVFTRKQWENGGGARGGDTITIHVHATPGTDKAALGKEVYELLKEYKRRSKQGGSLNL